MAKKTSCPITRQEFKRDAKPIEVVINGQTFRADPRSFSTGSLGWNINAKASIDIGGQAVPVQIGLNVTLVGSKELPQDPTAASAPSASAAPSASPPTDAEAPEE